MVLLKEPKNVILAFMVTQILIHVVPAPVILNQGVNVLRRTCAVKMANSNLLVQFVVQRSMLTVTFLKHAVAQVLIVQLISFEIPELSVVTMMNRYAITSSATTP